MALQFGFPTGIQDDSSIYPMLISCLSQKANRVLIITHLVISPFGHLLERQSSSVHRRRLPPDRKPQEDNHRPEGGNHLEPGLNRFGLFGRRDALAGLGAHGGGGGEVGGCGGHLRRRPRVFILGGHGQGIISC